MENKARCPTCKRLLKGKKAWSKPKPYEVTSYAREIGFICDGQRFCDFYEAKGWFIGKTHMKSWKAAVRLWKGQATPDKLLLVGSTPEEKAQKEAQKNLELEAMRQREYERIHGKKMAQADDLIREEV